MRVPSPAGYLRRHLVGVGSVVMSVALVAAVVAGTVGRKGHASSKVDLSTGSAWFPSPDVGTMALIDGTTVTRVTQVAVSAGGDRLEAVQAGSSSYALDHSSGQVVRVDGASLKAAAPVTLGAASDEHLAIRSTGKVTWAVERGGTIAQQLDPVTLSPLGPPLAFPGNAAAPVLGADGTLWLVDGGLLRSLRGAKVRTNVQLPQVGPSQLVMASGHPVVLDSANHRAIEINADSGRSMRQACFDNADPSALVAGSNSKTPRALAVSPQAGTLMISDLKGGGCKTVVLGDTSTTDRYGEPVEADGLIYVPDYAVGTVIVIDARTGTIAGRPFVDGDAGYHFKLLAYHGFVWFDDDHVDTAGIVTLNGATGVSTSRGDTQGKSVTVGHGSNSNNQNNSKNQGKQGNQNNQGNQNKHANQGNPGNPGNQNQGNQGNPGNQGNQGNQNQGNPGNQGNPRDQGNSNNPNNAPPTFRFTPDPGVVGQPVTFQDTTSGPHTVAGWTFASGNPATSTAQNPTVTWSSPGTFTVTLTVTRNGSATSAQQQLSIQPTVPALTISTTVLAGATVGQPYSQTLTATGGAGSYTWTASNLPAWLSGTENGVGTYTLTGTPPGPPGVSNQFKVTVSAGTQTAFKTYTINVADPRCAGNTVTESGNGAGRIVSAPFGCTRATFDVQGGIGGGAGTALFTEGAGASADITIAAYPVTDGEQFFLGSGGAGTSGFLGANGVGGSNPAGIPGGGGAGGTCAGVSGGGGGGESVVYRGTSPTTGTPLVVAAGGGGAGGGAGGGDSGNAGRAQHNASVGGGLPGTAIAGGAAGGGNATGGGNQSGGTGDSSCTDGLGGGGGGSGNFGGGGGGDGDGGGGGSNFVDPSIPSSTVTIGTYFESLPNTVTVTWS